MENCRKSCEINITLQIFIDSPWKLNLLERENYKQPLNDWNLNGYCRSNDAAIFLATYLSSKNEDKNKRDHYAINSVTGDWRLTEKKNMLYCFLFLYNLFFYNSYVISSDDIKRLFRDNASFNAKTKCSSKPKLSCSGLSSVIGFCVNKLKWNFVGSRDDLLYSK